MNREPMGKLYYSSSEVSTMLDLEPSVLRFWEDQFSQLRIKRNRAGKRMYREKDIELIRTIKRLTRDEGYTIAGARKKLQEFSSDRGAEKAAPPDSASESEILQWIRTRLVDMRERMD